MYATRLLVVLLSAGACAAVDARNIFRCNGSIVDTRMTAAEVLGKCGEPDARYSSSVPVRARGVSGGTYVLGTTTIEQWVYERRPGQFPAYLTFDGGRLRSIEFQYDRR